MHDIDHIDLLKLDIEGHELAALRGANIDSRTYFWDFFYFLPGTR